MNDSGSLTRNPSTNNNLNKMKERKPITQVMALKPSMQRIIQMIQTTAQKSCVRACQLFCLPIDSLLFDRVTCCSATIPQPKEDKNTQERLQTLPSTILIVNISNSTLVDCVIGDSYPSAVAERQPLMKESHLQKHAQVRCSCSLGQQEAAQGAPPHPPPHAYPPIPPGEQLNVNIYSSHLNCVIIGDNNHMHAEQVQPFD